MTDIGTPNYAEQLAATRRGQPTEPVAFPELQHLYKHVAADADPMTTFGIDSESDPDVAANIVRWIETAIVHRASTVERG